MLGNTQERWVTIRFKGFPATEVMIDVMDRVKAWPWEGKEEVQARVEYYTSPDKPAHFPFGKLRWDRADADYLLAELNKAANGVVEAIVCGVGIDKAAVKAAADARRQAAKAKSERLPPTLPADPAQVHPSLRFLLGAEAREQGKWFRDRLDHLPGGCHALTLNADRLEVNFPLIARADAALGGKIREMLRAAAALPCEVKDIAAKHPWVSVGWCIREGRPDRLTTRYVDGKKIVGAVDAALTHIAALHARLPARPAPAPMPAAPQSRSLRKPSTRVPTTPWDKACHEAEREARARFGLSMTDDVTTREQDAAICAALQAALAGSIEWKEKLAAQDAEAEAREHLRLGRDEVPNEDEAAYIRRAVRRAIDACPKPADCPF